MAPTYRERLRTEGLVLLLTGALGSALLLRLTAQSKRAPLNTAGQLLLVVALLLRFGRRGVRTAVERARAVPPGEVGTGEPTPLWHIPALVVVQALLVKGPERLSARAAQRAGWDASLRVTLGAALVGLAQTWVLEREIAAAEARTGRTFYRASGARLGRGTPLVYVTEVAQP